MARLAILMLRTAFLAFFALNAWNSLKDIESFHPAFAKSYQNFAKSLTSKTGVKLPNCMSADYVEQNSLNIAKGMAWTQLGLCAAALLLWSGFTGLVGLTYLLVNLIHLNVAKLNLNTKLTDFEPFLLALGLFAGSLALSCSGGSCNENKGCAFTRSESSAGKKSSGKKR